MLREVFVETAIQFIVTWVTSLPPDIMRKMVEKDEDPKQLFFIFLEQMPEWMKELEDLAREFAGKVTYKNLVLWSHKYAPEWFKKAQDILLSKKYLVRRLHEWSRTGTVKDLEEDFKKWEEEIKKRRRVKQLGKLGKGFDNTATRR